MRIRDWSSDVCSSDLKPAKACVVRNALSANPRLEVHLDRAVPAAHPAPRQAVPPRCARDAAIPAPRTDPAGTHPQWWTLCPPRMGRLTAPIIGQWLILETDRKSTRLNSSNL